ncbi:MULTISPECIES: hypothetical protein [unclassified Nodularia (in: cyanobacteria)]|uniref:hypothetical protein n=1 Tax=unclassified Nodularia (in: cyanobacteria) TaxID=2656917 RepID=UPI001D1127D9|nr:MULTISPECIES: hypothetical protein [unclassified Nodularia (in: cyanobacteria)]
MEKRTAKTQRTPRKEGLIGLLHRSSIFLPNWDAQLEAMLRYRHHVTKRECESR